MMIILIGSGGERNIFGNKYGQYLAAIQIAREERGRQASSVPDSPTDHSEISRKVPLKGPTAVYTGNIRSKIQYFKDLTYYFCQDLSELPMAPVA